uniref:Uncharacterized protein n=1 Tax=Trypanosoma congolense (strain IL3000) TaxID=1068625 RepID=G0UZR9_TRYCI|nr:conserved hypothetical protein [Trypanosoma congolense IL3000]
MNVLLVSLVMVIGWSIDKTDPEVQKTVSHAFYFVHGVLVAVLCYLFFRVSATEDTRVLHVKDPYTGETERMTVRDYDLSKWRELFFMKTVLPACVGMFVASWWEIPLALLVQCVSNPINTWNAPIVQIHLLGRKDENLLARPWKDEVAGVQWVRHMFGLPPEEQDRVTSGNPGQKSRKAS